MYKCKDCKQNTPYDYFAPDGLTCMDCISEEDYDLFRYADTMIGGEDV